MTRSSGVAPVLVLLLGSALAEPTLELEPVASGLVRPVYLTHASDQSGRISLLT